MNSSNSNSSHESLEEIFSFHEQNRQLVWAYFILSAVICILGTVCNVICLLAIFYYPRLRHRGNILVGHLVFLNIILCSTVYPMSFISVLLHGFRWIDFPHNYCRWIIYYYLSIHTLVWSECLLSLNRFVAVLLPHQYSHIATKRATIVTIGLSYVVPLCLNLYASATTVPTFATVPPFGGCLYNPKGSARFQLVHGVLGVYLPMTIIGVAYSIICIRVVISKLSTTQTLSPSVKRRVKMAQMLFAAFLWFCLTYLPQPILTAFFKSVYLRYPVSYFLVRLALSFGASTHAVVYAVTNREYRNGMLYILRCRKRQITAVDPSLELGNFTTHGT